MIRTLELRATDYQKSNPEHTTTLVVACYAANLYFDALLYSKSVRLPFVC